MENKKLYFWAKNYPVELSDFRNRHYEVLAESITHVYLRNLRTGVTFNIPHRQLMMEFEEIPMFSRK